MKTEIQLAETAQRDAPKCSNPNCTCQNCNCGDNCTCKNCK